VEALLWTRLRGGPGGFVFLTCTDCCQRAPGRRSASTARSWTWSFSAGSPLRLLPAC